MKTPNYCLICGEFINHAYYFCYDCRVKLELHKEEIEIDDDIKKDGIIIESNITNPFYTPSSPLPIDRIRYTLKDFSYLNNSLYGVFDFETTKIEVTKEQKFLLGGVYAYNKLLISDSISDIVSFMIQSEKKIFFAHNLGYDFRFMFEYIDKNYEFELVPIGSNVLKIVILHNSKVLFELRDSMRIFDMSLFKANQAFNKHYFKKNLDLGKIDYDKHNSEHREYLHNDCLGLYESLVNCLNFIGV